MLCKLSLKRLLYAIFIFSILICVHFLITVINNGVLDRRWRQHPPATDIAEKQTNERLLKNNYSKLEKNQLPEKSTIYVKSTSITEETLFNKLPWYFKEGTKKPKPYDRAEKAKIWPSDIPGNDRITEQLMYIPKDYNEVRSPLKRILLWHGLDHWVKHGRKSFIEADCPVNECIVTDDQSEAATVDAILFKDHFVLPGHKRPLNQVWILYLLECPHHTERLRYNDLINWTATYRRDSDIVTPYERWVYYDENIEQKRTLEQNFTVNKTHQVAWFVSNCNARNGRLNYAHELQKYISVDIYGFCGPLKCPRTQECFHLLDMKYKFYLAFENSNCVDYITEKFFVNGLQHDVLPIVMGARPEDYAAVAPYHSYIHVDDFESPKELARFLLKLDDNEELYNSYFQWKGTGEFINTQFFCRLCAMLHDSISERSYRNFNKWWKNINTCITAGAWPKKKDNS